MKKPRFIILFLLTAGISLAGCGPNQQELVSMVSTSAAATITAFPTATAYPTLTPYPTPTLYPTPTPIGVDQWVIGHYWSIKVVETKTEPELNGVLPTEDIFVLVDVQWKANSLDYTHRISGMDFELKDGESRQYLIAGMIYDEGTFASFGSNAKFQNGNWVISDTSGSSTDTFRLVFDIPSSAAGLSLWFQDLPLINLDLALP